MVFYNSIQIIRNTWYVGLSEDNAIDVNSQSLLSNRGLFLACCFREWQHVQETVTAL